MRAIVIAALVAVAAALPADLDVIPILRDDRIHPDAGSYSTNVETGNDIKIAESGSAGIEGQTNVQGVYSYIMEDGSLAEVKFIADENGFQPESSLLPVAPAFPHPIPQFVLDQIEWAEEQRKNQRD